MSPGVTFFDPPNLSVVIIVCKQSMLYMLPASSFAVNVLVSYLVLCVVMVGVLNFYCHLNSSAVSYSKTSLTFP